MSRLPPNEGDGRWRVGEHYGIHVYEGDRPVATFHAPEDAELCVSAVNVMIGVSHYVAERKEAPHPPVGR